MSGAYDAVVIGASVGGLAAAALLAGTGNHVLVLEREAAPPEPIGPLYALDPLLMSQLRLSARGLRFVSRDLPLALPGLALGRDVHETARVLSSLSQTDAKAWALFHSQLYELARRLRRWWGSELETGAPDWVLESTAAKAGLIRLRFTGADAFLATYFESDALIAALLFDASAGGFHVSEPGSALALVWRAAQEIAGLQGAAAMPVPGTLAWSLIKAASRADFRCCTSVAGLVLRNGAVAGVRLADREEISAPLVLSSLSSDATRMLSGMSSQPSGIGEARLLLSLRQPITFPPHRLILAERSDVYIEAHEAARTGMLAVELPMEMVAPAQDRIAVTIRPVPARLGMEDRVHLAGHAVKALSRQVPGAAALIAGVRFAPQTIGRASLTHLLAPPAQRVRTSIPGLYLCGADAEPLPSMSGRAARIAVHLAMADLALQK